MKKLLIILILFVSVTQSVKAQTKEETISWLQEKLQKYTYYDYFGNTAEDIRVNVSECKITINYTLIERLNGNITKYYNQYCIMPTDGVILSGRIEMKNNIAGIKEREYNHNESLTYITSLKITKGEDNLYERLQKAVDHLASFCPKTKEAF